MATVKPFRGIRPKKELAQKIASKPYDVLNSEEAKQEAGDNGLSFYHIIKPEIDLPDEVDHYSEEVYQKAKSNLQSFLSEGSFFEEEKPCFYVYAQTFWGKTQYGLVGVASVDDYLNDVIKKHELTRPDKEEDRKNIIRYTDCQLEPVFFSYPDNDKIDSVVKEVIKNEPEYNFTADDGIAHQFWVIEESAAIEKVEEAFKNEVPFTYVADGHHRTAAAAHVGEERRKQNSNHLGDEEYNYFLAVHFPASQLTIIDYNRVVKDLNNLSKEIFVEKIKENFSIVEVSKEELKPATVHQFSMYLDGEWYLMDANKGTFNDDDPIDSLDVTVLSKYILEPVLDIQDLRKSKRIDFVGGIRGLGELKKRVDSGEMVVAFALYPVSMQQLINIADAGEIMPPKTTWFEPKLRSGLILHSIK